MKRVICEPLAAHLTKQSDVLEPGELPIERHILWNIGELLSCTFGVGGWTRHTAVIEVSIARTTVPPGALSRAVFVLGQRRVVGLGQVLWMRMLLGLMGEVWNTLFLARPGH